MIRFLNNFYKQIARQKNTNVKSYVILYVLYQELDPINTQTIRTSNGEKSACVARLKPIVLRLAAVEHCRT